MKEPSFDARKSATVHLSTMPDFRSPLTGPIPVFDASGFVPHKLDIKEWEQREDLESERNRAQSQLDSLVEALGFPPDAVSEARALAGTLDRDLRVIRSALVNFADAALSREALRLIDRLAPNPDAVCDCGHPADAHAGVHKGRRVNWKQTPCAGCSCIDFAPRGRSRDD